MGMLWLIGVVYDFIHVSMIHNQSSSIPSDDLLTEETVFQLQTLADNVSTLFLEDNCPASCLQKMY